MWEWLGVNYQWLIGGLALVALFVFLIFGSPGDEGASNKARGGTF